MTMTKKTVKPCLAILVAGVLAGSVAHGSAGSAGENAGKDKAECEVAARTSNAREASRKKKVRDYRANAETVRKYLDGNDWHYKTEDTGSAMFFIGDVGSFNGLYRTFRFVMFVGDEAVQNYAILPASAKDRLPQMAEFITRANYGLTNGAFEMDYAEGQVRFRLTYPISAVLADENALLKILTFPPAVLNRYSKGFAEVLMGSKTPEAAVRECEKDAEK